MPKLSADIVPVLPNRTRLRWKREEARAVVAAFATSGLSIERFAAREGFKPDRVARWMRKLKVGMSPKFVELRPVGVRPRRTPIEIVLRSGHVLFVAESPAFLERGMLVLLARFVPRWRDRQHDDFLHLTRDAGRHACGRARIVMFAHAAKPGSNVVHTHSRTTGFG